MANISTRALQRKPSPGPNRWVTRALYLIFFLVLIFGFNEWRTRQVPDAAPGIVGVMIDGRDRTSRPFSLADFRAAHPGKSVALHFWAEWCLVCRSEEHSISRLVRDDDSVIVTIATQSGDADAVFAVLQERELDWPTVIDEDGRLADLFRLPGVPSFVVIAPDGSVSSADIGYTSEIGMRLRLWLAALNSG